MRVQGFTLLELMLVVAMAVILMGVGVPSLNSLFESMSAEATVNRLMREVRFARAQAINLNQQVVICSIGTDGKTCDGEVQQGLTVFADDNSDGILDAGEQTLQAPEPYSDAGKTDFKGSLSSLRFAADGLIVANSGSIYFCSNSNDYVDGVVVSKGGNVRFAMSSETASCPF